MHFSDEVELAPQTWTLAEARRFVGEVLARAAVSPSVQDELIVAVTEACSNVVSHAPGSGPYRLTVDVTDDRCLIQVRDNGPGFDPDTIGSVSLDRNGGRGLLLIRALVDEVRFEQRRPGVTVTMIKKLDLHTGTVGGPGHR
jgi:serine/threonine-protein kinase RsbW